MTDSMHHLDRAKRCMCAIAVLAGLLLLTGLITSCSADTPQQQRWYTADQVAEGKTLFVANCAACHGDVAQGLAENWKKRDANGHYPPPPLNGSAHAWHHPLTQLADTIEDGGEPIGGQMPGFKGVFTEAQKLAMIAYFQNFWSDEIYQRWEPVNQASQQ